MPVRTEREVYGKSLDFGERIIWKRWLESQNQKYGRRSRLKAPCCGKSSFRFRLLPDEAGFLYCQGCWDAYSQWQHNDYAQKQSYVAQPDSTISAQEASQHSGVKRPTWSEDPPTGKRQEMRAEEVHNILLCIDVAA